MPELCFPWTLVGVSCIMRPSARQCWLGSKQTFQSVKQPPSLCMNLVRPTPSTHLSRLTSVLSFKTLPRMVSKLGGPHVQAVGRIDEDGSRYLLGDYRGQLYLLALMHDGTSVVSLQLEMLGHVSPPATLSYLDNSVVFVGCADASH